MFQRILPFMEVATAVATACLVAFQLYRITEDRKTKNEWFNNTVNKVLDEVIVELERDEVVFRMTSNASQSGNYTFSKTKYHIQSRRNEQAIFEVDLTNTAAIGNADIPVKDHNILQTLHAALSEMEVHPSTNDSAENRNYAKRILVDNVTETTISLETPMEERITQKLIDTMLLHAFRRHGLSLSFVYEVRGTDDCLLFGTATTTEGSMFARPLFPHDPIAERYVLSLSFPKQSAYIYKTMGITVFVSLALLIVVMLVFFGTLREILRQKKMSQVRTDFVSNMTHELKTPITTILLASDMLKTLDTTGNKTTINLSQTIHTEGKKLLAVVEQVLQIAQFDKGKFKLKKMELDAHTIIRRAAESFEVQAQSRNAQIQLRLHATRYKLMADELHFTNALSNLIDNALKYSSENPVVTIATRSDTKRINIQVSDNGIGMSENDTAHIFEQFYRVHTGNVHNVKGFGLGLSYVKKVVEEHHGTIEVRSKLGKGSTFSIVVPILS